MATISIEEARDEFERLSNVIAQADAVRPRWNDLKSLLDLAEKLGTSNSHSPTPTQSGDVSDQGIDPFVSEVKPNRFTSAAAEVALRSGQLHMRDLLRRMHEGGWVGSGDDKRDKKNVYNTLAQSKRFKN